MAERIISHDPVGPKSLANETNERSYAPYGSTGNIHASKFVGSMPLMFPFAPSIACRQHNIKKWLAKKRPKLKPEHAKARLQWALAHKDWTAEDFQRVIYSGECSVEQEPVGPQRWVFSTPGQEAHVYRELLGRWLRPIHVDERGSPRKSVPAAPIAGTKDHAYFFPNLCYLFRPESDRACLLGRFPVCTLQTHLENGDRFNRSSLQISPTNIVLQVLRECFTVKLSK